jgi:hypothetical protein
VAAAGGRAGSSSHARTVFAIRSVPPALAYAIIALLVFGGAAVFIGSALPGEPAVPSGGFLRAARGSGRSLSGSVEPGDEDAVAAVEALGPDLEGDRDLGAVSANHRHDERDAEEVVATGDGVQCGAGDVGLVVARGDHGDDTPADELFSAAVSKKGQRCG